MCQEFLSCSIHILAKKNTAKTFSLLQHQPTFNIWSSVWSDKEAGQVWSLSAKRLSSLPFSSRDNIGQTRTSNTNDHYSSQGDSVNKSAVFAQMQAKLLKSGISRNELWDCGDVIMLYLQSEEGFQKFTSGWLCFRKPFLCTMMYDIQYAHKC